MPLRQASGPEHHRESVLKTGVLVTVEENALQGGFGSGVLEMWSRPVSSWWPIARTPDIFVDMETPRP